MEDDITPEERARVHAERNRQQVEALSSERYSALPEKTREFIRGLRDKDVENLQAAITLAESMATVGRLTKWMLLATAAMATAVTTIVTFYNSYIRSQGHS